MFVKKFLSTLYATLLLAQVNAMVELSPLIDTEKKDIQQLENTLLKNNLYAKTIIENQLKEVAEDQGYGYKTGNLKQLETVTEIFNEFKQKFVDRPLYSVKVPEFIGIPTKKVQAFLKIRGLDLSARWQQLADKYFSEEKQKDIATEFWNELSVLEKDIKKIFIDAAEDKTITSLDEIFNVNGVDAILKQYQSSKFMVRSTGKEDTDKLANAGGNESAANITPNVCAILKAMSKVIASYVSAKSFSQRLDSNDSTIFDAPFTPVVVQRMIEETNKSITSCGVIFTEEPEGGISKLQERDQNGILKPDDATGKVKTSRITLIQASVGHNEGVVNGIVPVDSYYMITLDKFNAIISQKDIRMAPSKEQQLKIQQNPKELISKPALNSFALMSLKLFADILENYYKKPMDGEFVVDNDAKIIYFVQARPIVHNQSIVPPASYVNDKYLVESPTINGNQIGVAGGAVRIITSREQILQASSLGEALSRYLLMSKKQAQNIKVVLVEKIAPTTSHEATSFRTFLKPVMCIDKNNKQLEGWLNQENFMLLIDIQREKIINVSNEKQAQIDDAITLGWCNYPIPKALSLIEQNQKKHLSASELNAQIQKKVNFFVSQLHISHKKHGAEILQLKEKSSSDLFAIIKSTDEISSKIALFALLQQKIDTIIKLQKNTAMYYTIKNQMSLLGNYLIDCMQNVLNVIDKKPGDQGYEQRLLATRFLEAILFQSQASNIINKYSFEMFEHRLTQEMVGLEALGKTKAQFKEIKKKTPERKEQIKSLQYQALGQNTLTPEVGQAWIEFLKWYQSDQSIAKDQRTQFKHLIKSLQSIESLFNIWLHTSFAQNTAENNTDKFTAILNEYDLTKAFLEELSQKKKEIDSLKIELWGEAKRYTNQFDALSTLLNYFGGKEFKKHFQDSPDLGKITAISIMGTFIDKFDLSIKELKASTEYQDTEKIDHIHSLLILNGKLLEKWLLLDQCLQKFSQDTYLIYLINTFITNQNDIFTIKDLELSANFNVSTCVLGSPAKLNTEPHTLEEFFTFFHQSLLNILGTLLNNTNAAKITLPNPIKDLSEKLLSTRSVNSDLSTKNLGISEMRSPISLVGISLTQKTVILKYNYILRSHSATIEIIYDTKEKDIHLRYYLFGDDEYGRWERISDFIEVISELLNIPTSIVLEKKSVTLYFNIDPSGSKNQHVVNLITDSGETISYGVGNIASVKNSLDYILMHILNNYNDVISISSLINKAITVSLEGTHITWLLGQALNKYTVNPQKDLIIIPNVIKIIEKCFNNQEYERHNELFLFKIDHSPTSADEGNCNNYYKFTSDNFKKEIKKYAKRMLNESYYAKLRATQKYYQFIATNDLLLFLLENNWEQLKSYDKLNPFIENILTKYPIILSSLSYKTLKIFLDYCSSQDELDHLAKLQVAQQCINSNNSNIKKIAEDFWPLLIKEDNGFEKALNTATKAITSQYLWELLIKHDHKNIAFNTAIKIATDGLSSENVKSRNTSLSLLKLLIKHDHNNIALNAAINIATDDLLLFLLENNWEQLKSYDKLNPFIENILTKYPIILSSLDYKTLKIFLDYCSSQNELDHLAKLQVAQQCISSNNSNIKKIAEDLWQLLIKEDNGFEKALNTATKAITSQYLWELLIKHDHENIAFNTAIKIATDGLSSNDYNLEGASLKLWELLIKDDHENVAFNTAIKIATDGLSSNDYNLKGASRKLWELLIKHDHENIAFNTAIKIATDGLSSDIWKILINNDHENFAFNTAINLTTKKKNPKLQPLWDILVENIAKKEVVSKDLWALLIEKDYNDFALNTAIKTATERLSSEDEILQKSSFDLWELLIEKNNKNSAINTAANGLYSENEILQKSSLALWTLLIEKDTNDIVSDNAISIATREIKNQNPKTLKSMINLLEILSNHGVEIWNIMEMIELIKDGDEINKLEIQKAFLSLLSTLIVNNKEDNEKIYTESVDIAIKFSRSATENALNLFIALIGKNKEIERVITEIENLLKAQIESKYIVNQLKSVSMETLDLTIQNRIKKLIKQYDAV